MRGPYTGDARYLAEDEKVALQVRRHLAVLLGSFMVMLGVIIAASAIGGAVSPRSGSDGVDTAVGIVVLFFVVRFLWIVLQWWSARIIVTDRRIFEVSGVLAKNVASMPLWKVTDMTYRRTIWGRLLGYGEMTLETAGQKQALDNIRYLPRPDHFYRMVSSRGAVGRPPMGRGLDEQWVETDIDDTGEMPRIIV